jgi:hypothetical protein
MNAIRIHPFIIVQTELINIYVHLHRIRNLVPALFALLDIIHCMTDHTGGKNVRKVIFVHDETKTQFQANLEKYLMKAIPHAVNVLLVIIQLLVAFQPVYAVRRIRMSTWLLHNISKLHWLLCMLT